MGKQKNQFICQICSYKCSQWQGKCPDCNEWNSLINAITLHEDSKNKSIQKTPTKINELSYKEEDRFKTGVLELDRVLGNGLVKGSVYLIGGEPGVGKSTLLLKALASITKVKSNCLYVCGEESEQQVFLRAQRLGLDKSHLYLIHECIWENIKEIIHYNKIEFVVLDSIQTTYSSEIASPAGSVTQLREVTHELVKYFKGKGVTALIVGHFTKDGAVAGPRLLEHMVDGVLKFESDESGQYRMLRPIKNRFGPTDNIGLFEMNEKGLVCVNEINNMIQACDDGLGRSYSCLLQGHRPVLAEIQALVVENKFNSIRRSPQGIELNRLSMMIAVLEKYASIPLSHYDIYINIINGFKLSGRESDLSLCASLISSFSAQLISAQSLFIGEVGLCGEVRRVTHLEKRIHEVSYLNFKKIYLSKACAEKLKSKYSNIEFIGLSNINELAQKLH